MLAWNLVLQSCEISCHNKRKIILRLSAHEPNLRKIFSILDPMADLSLTAPARAVTSFASSYTVEKWRNALSVVSHISGFELKARNCNRGLLLDEIAHQVLKKVSKTPLVENKVKEFQPAVSSQQQSGETGVVEIVGLGGVGKSILAKEFFNHHRANYDLSCFIYDVRENAAKNSLNLLWATLFRDLAQRDEQINGVNEGIEKLKRHLSSCHRDFIILDDVDHMKQLDACYSFR